MEASDLGGVPQKKASVCVQGCRYSELPRLSPPNPRLEAAVFFDASAAAFFPDVSFAKNIGVFSFAGQFLVASSILANV